MAGAAESGERKFLAWQRGCRRGVERKSVKERHVKGISSSGIPAVLFQFRGCLYFSNGRQGAEAGSPAGCSLRRKHGMWLKNGRIEKPV
jgi:hypothetical protein